MERETNNYASLLSAINEQVHASRQKLVDRGELVPINMLGISSAVVHEMVATGRLFTIEFNGTPFYPAFFNTPGLDTKKLGDLCQILGPLSGSQKWQFFTRPKNSLAGKSPIDSIKDGEDFALVNRAALIFISN